MRHVKASSKKIVLYIFHLVFQAVEDPGNEVRSRPVSCIALCTQLSYLVNSFMVTTSKTQLSTSKFENGRSSHYNRLKIIDVLEDVILLVSY